VDIFTAVYFVAIIIEMAIPAPLNQNHKKETISERRFTRQEKILLGLLSIGMFFVPFVYAATDWLDFANYTLPLWAGWLGVLLITAALFVFWRAHADLGLNWSPTPEILEQHELVTGGI
jgi:protein-S-isoprenylcysteine O-methyltransferase Ste14